MRKVKKHVTCPVCALEQIMLVCEEKSAWICPGCKAAVEGNAPHILQKHARYTVDRGGNCCTGFGGIAGEQHHKCYEK